MPIHTYRTVNATDSGNLIGVDLSSFTKTAYQNRWDSAPLIGNVMFDRLRVDLNGPS